MAQGEFNLDSFFGEEFAKSLSGQLSSSPEPGEETQIADDVKRWVIEPFTAGDGELERFKTVYSGSQVRIDWVITAKSMRLEWDAKLEGYLRPGLSVAEYDRQLLPALFYKLPKRMQLTQEGVAPARVEEEFTNKSDVTIEFRKGGTKKYDLKTRFGRTDFAVDFIGNKNPIKSLAIASMNGPTDFDYRVKLLYGEDNRDKATFSLPLDRRGRKAANPAIAEMILASNIHLKDIQDPGMAASKLAGLMYAKIPKS